MSVQVLFTSGQSSWASAAATTSRTEILEASVSQILEDSTPTQEWANEGKDEPHWHESANKPTISNNCPGTRE